MTFSDLLIPECKATPHPAAVASGTCPAPSPDPETTTPAPTASPSTAAVPDQTATHTATTSDYEPAHLPTTGLDLGWAVLGVVVCVLGVAAVLWARVKRR